MQFFPVESGGTYSNYNAVEGRVGQAEERLECRCELLSLKYFQRAAFVLSPLYYHPS
jgi:hypothetical protein